MENSFWNTSLTWSNNATYPVFTDCFQNTVLAWTPTAFILLTLPCYLIYLTSLPSHSLPLSWINVAKLCIALLQIIICTLEFVSKATEGGFECTWTVYFAAPIIETLGLIIVILYLELEKKKGFVTSGVLFIYWVLENISNIIPFYSKIVQKDYEENTLKFTLFYVNVVLSLGQLVLACVPEHLPDSSDEFSCPETRASFISRISYHWATRILVQGYKNPLKENDLFTLNPRDQTKTSLAIFEKKWMKQALKLEKKRTRRDLLTDEREGRRLSHGVYELPEINHHQLPGTLSNTEDEKANENGFNKVSLFNVLLRTFGWQLVAANFWKLFYDLLVFANPLLLQSLIRFAESKEVPSWKGYVLAGCFFLIGLIKSTCFHTMLFQSTSIGIRIKASVISAIFKKALRLSNRARTKSTVGEIVNLMSVDAEHLFDFPQNVWGIWSCPLQLILTLILLYKTVGYAVFAGLGVMLLVIPINVLVIGRRRKLQTQQMEIKDERIKLITEILNGIKILKLYAWEMSFGNKVSGIRKRELKKIRESQIIGAGLSLTWTITPFMVSLATFATYVYVNEDHRIDASTVFVAISLFNTLRFVLLIAPWTIIETVKSAVSMKRISKFLNLDVLDLAAISHNNSVSAVEIKRGTFSWGIAVGPCLTNVNLRIQKGSLVAVVGPVGSGKSSLISAMLGEMETLSGQINIDGSTAYVPQQAWIQNATLRDNILFGNEMKTTQYNNIVKACALTNDLDILPARDITEIGDKGINLSGGQRQRVSLARAVYFNTDVYLLDDPLSAVDSHVGKHIFENVIGKNGLLHNKTRILVTHGIHWLPFMDKIIVMSNGGISEIGSYDELVANEGVFANFLHRYLVKKEESSRSKEDEEGEQLDEKCLQKLKTIQGDSDIDDDEERPQISKHAIDACLRVEKAEDKRQKTAENKDLGNKIEDSKAILIEEEELEKGHVKWSVFFSYARSIGYQQSILIVVLYGCYQACAVGANIWLTQWTSDAHLQDLTYLPANSGQRKEKNDYYLGIYGLFGVCQVALVITFAIVFIIKMLRAAKVLHHEMLVNILRCPMAFFDTTPVGRIVNRFSHDVDAIENRLPQQVEDCLDCSFYVLATAFIITYTTPMFLTVLVPVTVMYILIQRLYIPASRQLCRLEANTRSPIYNNFTESLTGASVIKAFGMQEYFVSNSENRVDHNQVFTFTSYTLKRWLGFRLELLGSVIVCSAAVFAVTEREKINGSLIGLSISYALMITDTLNWLVRMVSEIETNVVSVERLRQYTTCPTEAELKTEIVPRMCWPDQGQIDFDSYSAKYREGLDPILKNINFNIKQGERVGVVGRTGAGKSSLALALFRLIEAVDGTIVIDKEVISELGVHDLRTKLTILPQEPVLFSGSIRMNLDPLEEHTDDDLWTALEHAHLKAFVGALPARLDSDVGEDGQNLSVGQRQLVCLARTLLRKSAVLVLDEATASVDLETDTLIQETIATQFSKSTVITIAHRLNTVINYDRILVLSNGEVEEFDCPQTLLQDKNTTFYRMAQDAGLI